MASKNPSPIKTMRFSSLVGGCAHCFNKGVSTPPPAVRMVQTVGFEDGQRINVLLDVCADDDTGRFCLCSKCFSALEDLRDSLALRFTSMRSTIELERTFN